MYIIGSTNGIMYSAIRDTERPTLVEPGMRYFVNETLKKCSEFKEKYKNHLFNLGILCGLVGIIAGVLIYKYKGKLTPQEKKVRENQKKQYVLNTIKNYQDAKRTAQQQLITGLPQWDSEYEAIMQDRGQVRNLL